MLEAMNLYLGNLQNQKRTVSELQNVVSSLQ